MIYIDHLDKYIYLGGFCKNLPIPTKESESDRKQSYKKELQWLEEQNLYFRSEYIKKKIL